MALTKNDCLLLLGELERSGVDTREATNKLVSSRDLSLDVVRFINQHRQLDLTKFYEKLRKSYNNKKSKLYTNIVKDIEDTTTVLTTLSSLQLQILLYAKTADNVEMFLSNARLSEISYVLYNYSKTYDLTPCLKLIRLIKSDIKALEWAEGRAL